MTIRSVRYAMTMSAVCMLIAHIAPVASAQGPPEDARLARSLSDEVRRLADDINTDLGRTREGRHASEDARELAQSIDEFRQNRRGGADPITLRQSYSSLHADWRHLRDSLSRPGSSSPVIDRDLARIDAIEEQLARALGLNSIPTNDRGPNGPSIRRMARALVDRSEGLVIAIDNELGRDPRSAGLLADARALAREADAWHDSLDQNTPQNIAARTFGTVDAIAVRVEKGIEYRSRPASITAAWNAYLAADDVIHRTLNVRSPHAGSIPVQVPGITVPIVRPVPVAPPPVVRLADALIEQTTAFVSVFGPNSGNVPEGKQILNDAERLVAASRAFRENVARRANPNDLAASFSDVDVLYQRLSRRVGRIAKGKTGPNIQQVAKIGAICEAIHRTLGMPGTLPVNRPF